MRVCDDGIDRSGILIFPSQSCFLLKNSLLIIIFMFILTILLILSTCWGHHYFNLQTYYIPHPDKVEKGGQDAHWANQQIIVISDGVGGWAQYGIDAGKYSKQLCRLIAQQFPNNQTNYTTFPQRLISYAHQNNNQDGSATLLILTIDESHNKIYVSNIGDCGYLILRYQDELKIFYDSPQQQHSFNFPFQLSNKIIHPETDLAENAENFEHDIQQGDIIIAGSDGLFDNLHNSQILSFVKEYFNNQTKTLENKGELARKLAQTAIYFGNDPTYNSPFSINAKRSKLFYRGGKLDDTTVVVAQIGKIESTQL